MTENRKTSTSRDKRLGCLIVSVGAVALWTCLVVALVALLAGCAAGPGDRWEALSVAGTAHTTVFQNGLPRSSTYTAVADGTGLARIYRNGRYVGTGTYGTIEPNNGYVRIEVSPNARIQITGQ